MYDVVRENRHPAQLLNPARKSRRMGGRARGKWIEIRDKCIINDFWSAQQRGCLCLFFIL